MNKALEQKLIGPMEESHTKEQSPKAVLWEVLWTRRSKIAAKWARTRAWAGWWFFWEEEEVCGCRNKWRGPPLAHEAGAHPIGVGAPWPLVARCLLPLLCSQFQIFSNIPEKILIWQGIWRTFISGVFLYCTDKSENKQENTILLYFN